MPKNKTKKQKFLPPRWASFAYYLVSKFMLFIAGKVKFNKRKLKDRKNNFLLIYNHYSNQDHWLIGSGLKGRRTTFVLTGYYYYNKKLAFFLDIIKAIKKDQFKPDTVSIRKMKRVVEKKGIIAIAPTGQVSVDGETGFLSEAIVKLIRLCNIDVIVQRSHGAHLRWPKWRKSKRKCIVDVEYDIIIKKDEIKELSDQEIYQKVSNGIFVDEYQEQKTALRKIKSKSLTAGLENVFLRCPKCGAKYSYISYKHELECCECHNHIKMNEYGFLEPCTEKDFTFETEAKWLKWQKEVLKNEYYNTPNYKLTTKVIVKNNPHEERVLEIVGEGEITLTHDRLYYVGTCLGKNCEIEFNYHTLVQLPYKFEHHFEVPTETTTYMFLPTDNTKIIYEWVQLVDIIRETRDNYE